MTVCGCTLSARTSTALPGTTVLSYGSCEYSDPRLLNMDADNYGSAYNDMLFLCEKYGTLPGEDRYDPQKDLQVTGSYKIFDPSVSRE